MAATIVYLDDNPARSATGGNKNGVCIGQQRRISMAVTFDDDTGTLTSPYNISHVDGLPRGAVAVITNSYLSGSVALTEVPEAGTTPHNLTLVCR